MAALPRYVGSKRALGATVLGVLASTGPAGSAWAAAILLSTMVLVLGWAGVLACIAARPVIDTLWNFRFLPSGDRLWNLQSIVGVVVPLAVITVTLVHQRGLRLGQVGKWFALYGAVSILGTLLNDPTSDAYTDYLRFIAPFAFYIAAASFASRGASPTAPAFVLATYGLIPAASGLLQMVGLISPIEGAVTTSSDWVTRVTGLYHHPYDIAIRCMISLPFALFLGEHLKNGGARVVMRGLAASLALVGVLTLVRTTLAGILVVLLGWFLLSKKWAAALLIALCPLILLQFSPSLRTVLSDAIRPFSSGAWEQMGTGRAVLFVAQVSAFREASAAQKIFGRGLHTTPEITERFSPLERIRQGRSSYGAGNAGAHNQFLRVLGESGIVGIAALIGLIGSCLVLCWRARSGSPPDASFATGVLVLTAALLVVALSFQPFDQPAVMWPFWFAIGLVAGRQGGGLGGARAVYASR